MPEVPIIDTAETIFNDYWKMIDEIQERIKTLPLYEAHLLQDMMMEHIQKVVDKNPEIMESFKAFL